MGGAVPHTPPLAVGGCAPPPPRWDDDTAQTDRPKALGFHIQPLSFISS